MKKDQVKLLKEEVVVVVEERQVVKGGRERVGKESNDEVKRKRKRLRERVCVKCEAAPL